jgi:hypothetical protein
MKTSRRFALLFVALFQPVVLLARTMVEAGPATAWQYLDAGPTPDAAWTQLGFDASQWKSGKAPLGYGETRLATVLDTKPFIAWFRHEFDASEIKAGEGLVILLCVDDGAAVYLNGKELNRTNLPEGPLTETTTALRTLGDTEEGDYLRIHVPAVALRKEGKNVLAVEVHNISIRSSDLYFDLALKTVPAATTAEVTAGAGKVVKLFNQEHFLGPDVIIPDGYIDGGRGMKIDAGGDADSRREILAVDREHDVELAADLAFARSAELRALPELERAQRIAERIDRETTPPGGMRWLEKTTEDLQKEFTGKALLIGDWVDQCHSGVCRHRSLLFKILADEAGLKSALVRGNFLKEKPPGFAHAWNEIVLENGKRLLVDVMHNGGKAVFRELTEPYVIEHYRKVDDTPWYGEKPKS